MFVVAWFLFFVCLEFQIIRFVTSTFTPIFFIEISSFYPPPPMLEWWVRCCKSDWPGLCMFCCYQPFCIVSQQSLFGLFLFHKFSNFTPPPPGSFAVGDRCACGLGQFMDVSSRECTNCPRDSFKNQTFADEEDWGQSVGGRKWRWVNMGRVDVLFCRVWAHFVNWMEQ